MLPDRLVMMANQIGKFFVAQGSPEVAVAGIADHITKFWDPRMRRAAFAVLREDASGLDPLPRLALERLAERQALTGTDHVSVATETTAPDVGDATES